MRLFQGLESYGPGKFIIFVIIFKFIHNKLFDRENLLERTRALQKKQRSGKIAPPTSPYTPLSVVNNSNRDDVFRRKFSRSPSVQIPDFTPLQLRTTQLRKSRPRPTLPHFDLDQTPPVVIPPTLLAPRYSHLLEEAIAISQEKSTTPSPSPEPEQETFSDVSSTIAISQAGWTTPSPEQETFSHFEVKDTSHSSDIPSNTTTTIGKRVKGLLFSYLPTLSKSSSSSSTTKPPPISVQPSLPIPPIEILSKPRGPISTPARAPIVKPKHPKELVVLHPAPQPPRPPVSQIPRLKKPQRLVELRPPPPPPTPLPIPRPRRSSGSSVKDLVRGFEDIQSVSISSRDRDSNKLKYGFGWKTITGDQKRPQWKP